MQKHNLKGVFTADIEISAAKESNGPPQGAPINIEVTGKGDYKDLIAENGIVQLKTDSPELYAYTQEVLQNYRGVKVLYDNPDIYSKQLDFPDLEFKTYYEKKHLIDGRKIKYLRFSFV